MKDKRGLGAAPVFDGSAISHRKAGEDCVAMDATSLSSQRYICETTCVTHMIFKMLVLSSLYLSIHSIVRSFICLFVC